MKGGKNIFMQMTSNTIYIRSAVISNKANMFNVIYLNREAKKI